MIRNNRGLEAIRRGSVSALRKRFEYQREDANVGSFQFPTGSFERPRRISANRKRNLRRVAKKSHKRTTTKDGLDLPTTFRADVISHTSSGNTKEIIHTTIPTPKNNKSPARHFRSIVQHHPPNNPERQQQRLRRQTSPTQSLNHMLSKGVSPSKATFDEAESLSSSTKVDSAPPPAVVVPSKKRSPPPRRYTSLGTKSKQKQKVIIIQEKNRAPPPKRYTAAHGRVKTKSASVPTATAAVAVAASPTKTRRPPPKRFTPERKGKGKRMTAPPRLLATASFVDSAEEEEEEGGWGGRTPGGSVFIPPPPMISPPRHLLESKMSVKSIHDLGKALLMEGLQNVDE